MRETSKQIELHGGYGTNMMGGERVKVEMKVDDAINKYLLMLKRLCGRRYGRITVTEKSNLRFAGVHDELRFTL